MKSRGTPIWVVVLLVLTAYAVGRSSSTPTVVYDRPEPINVVPKVVAVGPLISQSPVSIAPPSSAAAASLEDEALASEASPASVPSIDTSQADVRFVSSGSLFVLDSPVIGAPILKRFSQDDPVLVMADDNGWSMVSLGQNQFGWVRSSFLRSGQTPSSSALQTAIAPSSVYVAPAPVVPLGTPSCSETGSCYGDISKITGLPKTTFVHGYFRKNGTYVGSYYRSHR